MSEHTEGKVNKAKGGWIFFVAGLVASLILGWGIFPKLIESKKLQPVDFSHLKHIESAGMQCEECHKFRADGSYEGIPKLAQCLQCHESPQGESKEEADFIKVAAKLKEKGEEIPWLIYSKQPDCVFFSHAAHVKMAKLECTVCHKSVGGKTDKNPVYAYKWISGYAPEVMMMETCESCHQKKKTSNACFVCHK
jgi:hypothetical protein